MKHRSKQLARLGSVVGLHRSESRLHCLWEWAAMRCNAQPGPCLLPRSQAAALVLPASSSSKLPGQRQCEWTLAAARAEKHFILLIHFPIFFIFIFIFLQGKDTNRSFSCSSFAQTDDIRKYLCVISELRLNFWSKIQQSQHVKLELNVSSIQEIV